MDAAWKKAISDAKKGASKLSNRIGNTVISSQTRDTPAKYAGGNTGKETITTRVNSFGKGATGLAIGVGVLGAVRAVEGVNKLQKGKTNQKAIKLRDTAKKAISNNVAEFQYHARKASKLGIAATYKSGKKTNWD